MLNFRCSRIRCYLPFPSKNDIFLKSWSKVTRKSCLSLYPRQTLLYQTKLDFSKEFTILFLKFLCKFFLCFYVVNCFLASENKSSSSKTNKLKETERGSNLPPGKSDKKTAIYEKKVELLFHYLSKNMPLE